MYELFWHYGLDNKLNVHDYQTLLFLVPLHISGAIFELPSRVLL
jgi:hypothetical protein